MCKGMEALNRWSCAAIKVSAQKCAVQVRGAPGNNPPTTLRKSYYRPLFSQELGPASITRLDVLAGKTIPVNNRFMQTGKVIT